MSASTLVGAVVFPLLISAHDDPRSDVFAAYQAGHWAVAMRTATEVLIATAGTEESPVPLYEVLAQSRLRIERGKRGLDRLPLQREWSQLTTELTRAEAMHRLCVWLPEVKGIRYPPAGPTVMAIRRMRAGVPRSNKPENATIDPVEELVKLNLQRDDIETLLLHMGTNWYLRFRAGHYQRMTQPRFARSRTVLCVLINEAYGQEVILPGDLPEGDWREPSRIRARIEYNSRTN